MIAYIVLPLDFNVNILNGDVNLVKDLKSPYLFPSYLEAIKSAEKTSGKIIAHVEFTEESQIMTALMNSYIRTDGYNCVFRMKLWGTFSVKRV